MSGPTVYFRLRCSEDIVALLGACHVPRDHGGVPGLIKAAKHCRTPGVIIVQTTGGAHYLRASEIVGGDA
jgi:hypothetical protein